MEQIITGRSEEFKALDAAIDQAKANVEKLFTDYRPLLGGEHYLTTEEVCMNFRISSRALQKYRDE